MSSNYRRGGGGAAAGAGAGGGGNNSRRRNNKRSNNQNQQQQQKVSLATTTTDEEEQQPVAVNNNQIQNNNEVVTTTTTTTSDQLSEINNSSSSDGGTSTPLFTADEGEDDDDDDEHDQSSTVQEISSEEDEEIDEPASIVNASLIVNLSNANVSQVLTDGDRSSLVLEEGSSPEVKKNVARSAAAPVKEPEVITIGSSSDDDEDDEVVEVPVQEERIVIPVEKIKVEPVSSDDEKSPRKKKVEGCNVTATTPSSPKKQNDSKIEVSVSSPAAAAKSLNSLNDDDGIESAAASEEDEDSTLADSEVEKLMMRNKEEEKAAVAEWLLPSTVTVLRAPNGVVVYLVGTAHFSQQSQVDVAETIQMTRPTIVVLELCSSRKNILDLDEETVLREVSEMNFQKVRLALSNSGTVQGTLHLLLLSMSAQLTKKLGMAPGGEFRVATREARKLPGRVVLLGDRPFNITISRALAALSVFQKIKLAWQFLTCNEDITRDEIEKCKEKDLLERMLTEMTGEFPSITEVFVNERDVYLAHSLYIAATSEAHKTNGGPVVGVVGMGHVAGIVRNWGKTSDEMVNEIVRIPQTPISTIIL